MLQSQSPNPAERRPFLLLRPFIAGWRWMFPPTQAHADRQSRAARVAAGVVVIGFFTACTVLALMNARKWHDAWQTWQSNRLVRRAEVLEREDRLMDAWSLATEAYQIAPDNPGAIRTLARFYTARKQREALYLLDKLERLGAMTEDDVVVRIQALSNACEDKAAQAEIEEILRTSRPSKKLVEAADSVMQRLGRAQQFIAILKNYANQRPDDRDMQLRFAMRQVELGTPVGVAEGMASLWRIAEGKDKAGLGALEFLDRKQVTGREQQTRLADLLQTHPLAGEPHRIAALRWHVVLEPTRRNEFIEKAVKDRQDARREELVPLAEWLNREGEHVRLVQVLKEDVVQDYPPLLGHYLNALTHLKRHDDLARLVKDPRTRLTTAERAFYKAHLAYVTHKDWHEVNSLLVDALNATIAARQPERLLQIAQWAERRDHLLVAKRAYRAASGGHGIEQVELLGFEGLLRLSYLDGDSEAFMEAARATARRWPDNQSFLERLIYASLLSGVEMEPAILHARKLLEDRPADAQRMLLMALACHRMSDLRGMVTTLKSLDAGELTSAGHSAVLCGLLHATGDRESLDRAAKIAGKIPAGTRMLPEEQRFLTMARADSPPTTSPSAAPDAAGQARP